ncbi:hypothetical protein BDQ17DRAFT_274369 [Cyathus striatus]|nr:hypothetical protein BDQ17DRAFT_274369 [Cyathus striatus]
MLQESVSTVSCLLLIPPFLRCAVKSDRVSLFLSLHMDELLELILTKKKNSSVQKNILNMIAAGTTVLSHCDSWAHREETGGVLGVES